MPRPVVPQHRGQLRAIAGQQTVQFTREIRLRAGIAATAPADTRSSSSCGWRRSRSATNGLQASTRGSCAAAGLSASAAVSSPASASPARSRICCQARRASAGQCLRQVCGVQVHDDSPPMIRIQASIWGATRMTSSMVVSPRATRAAPLRRRVRMPSPMAISRILAVFSCGLICACTARLFTSTS